MRLQAKGRAYAKALGRRQQARFKEPKGAASGGDGMGPARGTKACQSGGGPYCGWTNGEQLGALQQWLSCRERPGAGPGNRQTSERGLCLCHLVAQLWTEKLP